MFKGTLLPAIIEKISTLKDGSVSLTIYTQELSPQKAAELFSLRGKTGALISGVTNWIQNTSKPQRSVSSSISRN